MYPDLTDIEEQIQDTLAKYDVGMGRELPTCLIF